MAETFSNSLINNSIFHLLNFEKYSNFQAAAREAAINNNFQLVLFSTDFNTVFSVETKHNTSIEEAVLFRGRLLCFYADSSEIALSKGLA